MRSVRRTLEWQSMSESWLMVVCALVISFAGAHLLRPLVLTWVPTMVWLWGLVLCFRCVVGVRVPRVRLELSGGQASAQLKPFAHTWLSPDRASAPRWPGCLPPHQDRPTKASP